MSILAAEIQSGQILGTLGASGAALAATVFLVVGVKGKHKIKLDADQAAVVGLIAGTLYATAASVWSTPGSIAQGMAGAVRSGVGGRVGMGAIALVIVLVIYGMKLRPRTAALLGIAAASVFAAAGGLWGIVSTFLASGLNQILGVA